MSMSYFNRAATFTRYLYVIALPKPLLAEPNLHRHILLNHRRLVLSPTQREVPDSPSRFKNLAEPAVES